MKNSFILILSIAILSISCSKKKTYDNRVFDKNSIENGINSYFTIEKTLISPKLPVQSNLITFYALDYYKKPISGLDVKIDVDPDNSVIETLAMPEISTGIYQVSVSKDNNYSVKITPNYINFMSNRNVGNIIVVNNPYCYSNNRLNWENFDDEGNGTSINPYKICTVKQLKDLSNNSDSSKTSVLANDKHYILMNDLFDIEDYLNNGGSQFMISESISAPFTGTINGNNAEIKNFTHNGVQIAFIKYASSTTIYDLKYSYKYNSPNNHYLGGLIYEIISSALPTHIYSINFTGNVELSTSSLDLELGGLIRKVSSNTSIVIENITGNINFEGKGKMAGLVSEVIGTGSTYPLINKAFISGTMTNSDTVLTVSKFAGLVNDMDRSTITNSHSSIIVNSSNGMFDQVAGLVNNVVDSEVSKSYSEGSFTLGQVNNYGGLFGKQTNSQVKESFTVANASGICINFCGKVLGQTLGGISTDMSNLYVSNEMSFVFSGAGIITQVENFSPAVDFHDSLNLPLSIWDFTNTWEEVLNNYPKLR